MSKHISTADLYDQHHNDNKYNLQIMQPLLKNFGGKSSFSGKIFTIKVFEDNSLVRANLEKPGENRVMVVDGDASLKCALLGDKLAQLAIDNHWNGLIINGCIRDSETVAQMDLGVKAITTNPVRSKKNNQGKCEVDLYFSGILIKNGYYVYSDEDGIIVSSQEIS